MTKTEETFSYAMHHLPEIKNDLEEILKNYNKLLEFAEQINQRNPESYKDKAFMWICLKTINQELLKEIGE